jgi:peptidoglycan L-alanyl-D-glutamate endopeptidase CwlK
MINSRKIDDLQPHVAAKAQAFIDACAAAGIDVILTSTYRDHASQAALYAKGRTAPGPRVTNANEGRSYHNWRVAFDFVPIKDGKCIWNDDHLWAECGRIGMALGLEWGGSWHNFVDRPHMQDTGGRTIAQFMAGAPVRA